MNKQKGAINQDKAEISKKNLLKEINDKNRLLDQEIDQGPKAIRGQQGGQMPMGIPSQ